MSARRRLLLEPLDQLFLGVMRRMHAEMRQVQKKRLVLVPPDEIDGLVRQPVRQIRACGDRHLRRGREIKVLAHRHDGLSEAAPRGVIIALLPDVPFAEHPCGVAGVFQVVRDGLAIKRQIGLVDGNVHLAVFGPAALERTDGIDAGARRILARQDRRPRRRAVLAVVIAGQPQPLLGQPVDMRRLVIRRALAAQVRPTQVVCQDEDNVRRPPFAAGRFWANDEHSHKHHPRETPSSSRCHDPSILAHRVYFTRWAESRPSSMTATSAAKWPPLGISVQRVMVGNWTWAQARGGAIPKPVNGNGTGRLGPGAWGGHATNSRRSSKDLNSLSRLPGGASHPDRTPGTS